MKKTVQIMMVIMVAAFLSGPADGASNKEMLFNNGVLFFKQNQYQSAIDAFSELIKISPEDANAYKNRGVAYLRLNQYDLAIQDFEQAKTIHPESRGIYSNLGVAWFYKKDYPRAIENYTLDISQNPDNYIAWFNRALSHVELAAYDQALDDLDRALELKPEFYWAFCYKGDLHVKTRQFLQAKNAYERAVQLEPDEPYARTRLDDLEKQMQMLSSPPVTSDQTPLKKFVLQAGAFKAEKNADRLYRTLVRQKFEAAVVSKIIREETWHVVQVGSFDNALSAESTRDALEQKMKIKAILMSSD